MSTHIGKKPKPESGLVPARALGFPAKDTRYSPSWKLPASMRKNGVFQRPVPLRFKSVSRGSFAFASLRGWSCKSPDPRRSRGTCEYRGATRSPGRVGWAPGWQRAALARGDWLRALGSGRGLPPLSGSEAAAPGLGTESRRRGLLLPRSPPGSAAPGASGDGPEYSGEAAGCPRAEQPGLSADPKCKAGLFPDAPGRGAPQHVPKYPGVPRERIYAPGRGALTMEHGLREAGVVMMTATAAGASSHRP